MKKLIAAVVAFFVLSTQSFASVDVYFSPENNCEVQFVSLINKAHHSIKISCFGITNANIYSAILAAFKRGVKVLICEDKMQAGGKHDLSKTIKAAGIEDVIKKVQVLEHNKILSVDGMDAIIGSWNLSENAQSQDNSIVVFQNEPEIVSQIDAAIERIYKRDKI